MKKKVLYLLLFFTGIATAQVVNIPDINFKNRLLNTSPNSWVAMDVNGNNTAVDTNMNGQIEESEALQIRSLIIYYGGWGGPIQSLQGIEYFTNLEYLDCGSNQISTLDVSILTNLKSLNCRYNMLSSLNVNGLGYLHTLNMEHNPLISFAASGLTSLVSLRAGNCQLTSFDLSLYPNLNHFECNNNQLTALDASMIQWLQMLSCENNQIASLNIAGLPLQYLNISNNPLYDINLSGFTSLEGLYCINTGISSLDLTGYDSLTGLAISGNPITTLNTNDLTALTYIECANTLLTELDLSHSPNIPYFHAFNNPLLTSINLHNGGLIEYAGECIIANNPNLQFICVDEGEEDVILQYFEWNELPPVYMSTDCTFTPGQVYNAISGSITYDFNNDGCDANDAPASYVKVVVSDGTNQTIRFADAEGDYLKYVGTGDFTITPFFDDALFVAAPASGSVSFADFDGSEHTQDFCLTANGIHPDAEAVIVTTIPAVPGFSASYKILIRNKGNQTLSGDIVFDFNDSVLDFVSAIPAQDNISGGMVTWNYTDLHPFESRQIYITLDVNAPTDTPAVNIDDVLDFTATVNPVSGDDTPTDNVFALNQTVVGAYDPNNIICLEGDTEDVSVIGDYLHYVVNFENTGNAAATFVVVTQQIDTAMFDVNSLELLGSSHNVAGSLTGNMLEFRFENVNLTPAGQGNVVFKLKTLQTLQEGDEVMNKANIVFDYNFGIPTNEAVTTFQALLRTDGIPAPIAATVYPNPVRNAFTISSADSIKEIQLYDISGRLLQTTIVNNTDYTFDISARAAGTYFVKIVTANGVQTSKIIKE